MNIEIQEAFFMDHQSRFSSETTRSYKLALQQFFSFCQKNYDQIKAKDIRDWLASMDESGLKPRSIQLKLSAVKSFYRYCLEENKLKSNPTLKVRTPQKVDSLPYYLDKRQLALLQELTKDHQRDRAIIEALYSTGVRISELLNIQLEDVKWDTRQIWIRKGKGNKERFVLFSHDCAERLNGYLAERKVESKYLISNQGGGPLSRCFVELLFRQYTEKLGFRVTPHTMRHTFAAHLAEKGMDFTYIQELLGHININSTRIYTRLMNTARKKQYDRFQT
ncbi:tyrosine-type recombinase/integrase [Sporosarcina sp. ACRSM]|uniref:site-specific tyrosine recombinase/integron integrase n=1 Tax=Sporosarcina sp. ACRSM TaxID=2918216 RepID=UPI001EF43A62|nr:site-specific tyrosine recombinase/integron integrase [Sporosarcina sp. ACRSM]MCG7337172.1 tyrosine-type recombinase/integrase [Sporosarcina sp. ACRSM]